MNDWNMDEDSRTVALDDLTNEMQVQANVVLRGLTAEAINTFTDEQRTALKVYIQAADEFLNMFDMNVNAIVRKHNG